MDEDFLKSFQDDISKKIGEEYSAVIADNFAELFTKNREAIEVREATEKALDETKQLNEKLIASNGSLLKQIPVSPQSNQSSEPADNIEEEFNIRTFLNPDGTFKEKK